MAIGKVWLKWLSGAQSFVWLFPWETLPKIRWLNAVKPKIDGEWWTSSGPFSLSSKLCYGQISWSINIARLDVIMIVSHWHLTGISAALLSRPLKSLNRNLSASLQLKCDLRLVAIFSHVVLTGRRWNTRHPPEAHINSLAPVQCVSNFESAIIFWFKLRTELFNTFTEIVFNKQIERQIQAGFRAMLTLSGRHRVGSGLIQIINFKEFYSETKHTTQIMIRNEYKGVCQSCHFVRPIFEKMGIIGSNQEPPLLTWLTFNPTMHK